MLKIKDLCKSYGKTPVLKGVNFHVKENEIKAIIGMNGAGKSTMLENVCGIKPFNSGTIEVAGLSINNSKSRQAVKQIIGYMPQKFGMFSDLTVEENLKWLAAVYQVDDSVVESVMEQCFIIDKRKALAQNLSGGYKQLLSLAGAIIHKPKLLILDEPTAAMDPLFRDKFWMILKQAKQNGATIVVITHHIEELNYCDSFACLYCGEIVHEALVEQHRTNNVLNIEEVLKIYKHE